MYTGFIYDGISTESLGLIICELDSSGEVETVTVGSEINWNRISINKGTKHPSTSATYDNILNQTFKIMKYDCKTSKISPFTSEERRFISRWLNREDEHELQMIGGDDIYNYVHFEGSFNLSEIRINGEICGYELYFESNRPFAIGNLTREYIISDDSGNYTKTIYDTSDKIGFLYPKKLTIKCLSSGNLTIHNSIEDRKTAIDNCSEGEIITFDDALNFSTSLPSHEIQEDFNYTFFRIANTVDNRKNTLTISLPCAITIEYYPVIKGVSL